MSATREQLLTAYSIQKVPAPEVKTGDRHVYVRTITAAEVVETQEIARQRDADEISDGELVSRTCAIMLSDDVGKRLFPKGDEAAVLQVPFCLQERALIAGFALNGMDPGSSEEALGNSDDGPSDSSPSG